jgi:antitoxin HigA-1
MKHTKPTDPVHPGEILLEDFMKPCGISINGLALDLHVPATRISAIVNEARGISADTALRLARYFGTSGEFWMNLQQGFDLRVAANKARTEIEQAVRPRNAA